MSKFEIVSFALSLVSLAIAIGSFIFTATTFRYKLPRGKVVLISAGITDYEIHLHIDFENASYYSVTVKKIRLLIDDEKFTPTRQSSERNAYEREETKNIFFPSFTCATFSALFKIENASKYAGKQCTLIVETTLKTLKYSLSLPSELNVWRDIL